MCTHGNVNEGAGGNEASTACAQSGMLLYENASQGIASSAVENCQQRTDHTLIQTASACGKDTGDDASSFQLHASVPSYLQKQQLYLQEQLIKCLNNQCMPHLDRHIRAHGILRRVPTFLARPQHRYLNMESAFSIQPIGRFHRPSEAVKRPKVCSLHVHHFNTRAPRRPFTHPTAGVRLLLIRR